MTMVDKCGFRGVADERRARYAGAHRRQQMKLYVLALHTKIELVSIFVANKYRYLGIILL